jgi:hypothetical protein
LETRLTTGEKPNRKRMAEVATVYTIDKWPRTIADVLHGVHDKQEKAQRRPRPTNKRVWASIVHTPQRVIRDAFDEAMRRDPELRRRWIVLVDGNKDQIERIRYAARETGVKITIVLGIVHVLEYLWRAAHAFMPTAQRRHRRGVECRLGRHRAMAARSVRRLSCGVSSASRTDQISALRVASLCDVKSVRHPPAATRTTSASNISNVTSAAVLDSCDVNSGIAYEVNSAINTYEASGPESQWRCVVVDV